MGAVFGVEGVGEAANGLLRLGLVCLVRPGLACLVRPGEGLFIAAPAGVRATPATRGRI
jgi:hypothetical protein